MISSTAALAQRRKKGDCWRAPNSRSARVRVSSFALAGPRASGCGRGPAGPCDRSPGTRCSGRGTRGPSCRRRRRGSTATSARSSSFRNSAMRSALLSGASARLGRRARAEAPAVAREDAQLQPARLGHAGQHRHVAPAIRRPLLRDHQDLGGAAGLTGEPADGRRLRVGRAGSPRTRRASPRSGRAEAPTPSPPARDSPACR